MSAPASTKQPSQGVLSTKTQAIAIGLVLAIIGSLVCSSFAKDSLTNYAGFGMMLTGIGIFILAMFATAATTLRNRTSHADPNLPKIRSPNMLYLSVWSLGVGVFLTVIGFMLSNTYAKYTILNDVGYQMLLGGSLVALVGIAGAIVSTGQMKRPTNQPLTQQQQQKIYHLEIQKSQLMGQITLAAGVAITIAGYFVAGNYAKETIENYAGFGTLLIGIAILSVGVSQTVAMFLRNRWNLVEYCAGEDQPRVMLGSIWAISIGAMLVINGSLIASSYAKNTIMNYAGFGMLLAGTAVFVYGMFVTARLSAMSAMGYISSKRALPKTADNCEPKPKIDLTKRLQDFGKNLVKTSAILNLAGVMFSIGLLFFSLWQLDLIVSGPVWWESSAGGAGWSWPGPGAYANDYFQCFLWKTTIGQAYDTLFMLIFISFIVLFASAFFWPRFRKQSEN
jgi:hypothetical protein